MDIFYKWLSRVLVIMAFVLKDLKANESRLKDINKVAEDLESEGLMAEEVQAVQQQVGVRIWPRGRLHGHRKQLRSPLCSHSPTSSALCRAVARVQIRTLCDPNRLVSLRGQCLLPPPPGGITPSSPYAQ